MEFLWQNSKPNFMFFRELCEYILPFKREAGGLLTEKLEKQTAILGEVTKPLDSSLCSE